MGALGNTSLKRGSMGRVPRSGAFWATCLPFADLPTPAEAGASRRRERLRAGGLKSPLPRLGEGLRFWENILWSLEGNIMECELAELL